MSGGGKGGGDAITGYRYFMGMHIVPCRGPVDSVNSFIFGERVGWTGAATSSQQIYIDKYELFGGESREGGVRGYVDICMGDETQLPNDYLKVAVNGGTVKELSSWIASIVTSTGTDLTVTIPGSPAIYVFTMTATPDSSGNTNYRVIRVIMDSSGTVLSSTQLINTTYPANTNAEAEASNVFPRTSETTSSTDGLTGITTYQTVISMSNVPAFRGLLSLVFRSFMWSAVNPYFKSLWVNVSRWAKGWNNDVCWYPAKVKIGTYDMNPAHIIYQCMTDPEWGMGENITDFDETVWRAAADQLYAEGFGLSLRWTKGTTIEAFIQLICDHINAAVRLNIVTGLFELVLIRDNYTIASLTELNVDNVVELKTFERAAYGELCSQVIVNYTTRDDQTTSVSVQDGAGIQAQGGVVSTSRDYIGIRDEGIALRVAQRDLQVLSSPLAKVSLECNRVLWNHNVGDVFVLTWGPLNLTSVVFRITAIDKGNILSGVIAVEAVEDVFGLPGTSYASAQTSKWVDPNQDAHAIANYKLVESTYWDTIRNTSSADFAYLPSDFAFVQYMARYGTGSSINFDLYAAPSNVTANYYRVTTGHYTPRAILGGDIGHTTTSVGYVGASGFDSGIVGSYAYIDDECVAIDAINVTTGKLTIRRGVLDTVPAKHVAGAPIWAASGLAYDSTVRERGEAVYYRACPRTATGIMALGSTPGYGITLQGRAEKPYPPGQFKVGGSYYPSAVTVPLTASWTHRDRTQQTVSLNDYTYGSVGPETGVTYTLKVVKPDGTVVRTVTGITGVAWTYDTLNDIADGCLSTLRLQLSSVRGSLSSYQSHDFTVERYGLGLRLGQYLGTFA